MKLKLIATTTFGLEAVVRREIEKLGYEIERVTDGKIIYIGDERAIVRSNLWLRSADRVLLEMGVFGANDFEELFQNTKGIEWEHLIPPDGAFPVTGSSVKSTLHSVPACQSIVKKAIAERLMDTYHVSGDAAGMSETGAKYAVKVSILKDAVTISVDTSGTALHKRGYRVAAVPAPLKETMAAALIDLSFWNPERTLLDPCCGSGTIAIEAAMIGMNIAPGLSRKFVSEEWNFIDDGLWREERKKAFEAIKNRKLKICAADIDPRAIDAAKKNIAQAGLTDQIVLKQIDISDIKIKGENGIIITNPPYGERIGNKKGAGVIYHAFARIHDEHPDWSLFMISPDRDAEKLTWGRGADRRRKLYNGNIEVCYYQFHGERIRQDNE